MNPDMFRFNEERFFKRRFEGEWMIADLKSGDYFTVEGAGSLVFDEALAGRTTGEIVAKISKVFPGEPSGEIRSDVDEFIGELVRKKILV